VSRENYTKSTLHKKKPEHKIPTPAFNLTLKIFPYFLPLIFLRKIDRSVRAGRDADPVEIAAVMVDDRHPVDNGDGILRADPDAFPRSAAFFRIDDDFHSCLVLSA
jgi:hypothetical protein